ncbi:MAG TPA: LON peptidase substrate-binding domain-containing protein [Gaiellaceae bacterium]
MPELGLFPLPLVLMPTERLPLHIFEERYKELIAECLESDDDFGLVLATGDGAVHEVGTRAAVDEVLDMLDDGAMNVVVRGGDRFRLLELTSGRSFTTCLVEPVEDDDEVADSVDVARALELFGSIAAIAETEIELPDADTENIDFVLAARIDFGADAKQDLLATTSPRERMTKLLALLELALESTQLQKTLRERAGKNGQVSPLGPGEP